jgi:hypothetical protein
LGGLVFWGIHNNFFNLANSYFNNFCPGLTFPQNNFYILFQYMKKLINSQQKSSTEFICQACHKNEAVLQIKGSA